MKYILCILFITNLIQSQIVNQIDENGKKNGLWRGFYPDSKRLRYEGTFEHGKEIGIFKFFDDTKKGTLIATREFNVNDNSCYTIFYNQNNNKVSEGKVVDKKFEGKWIYYHEDSPSIMTEEFYLDGKLEGIRKVFYKSRKIAEETTYKNGKKDGAYKNYAENGILLEESNYKNGEYDGMTVFKSAENKITGKGLYKNGKKVGIWKILQKDKLVDVNMNKQGKKFQKRIKPIQQE